MPVLRTEDGAALTYADEGVGPAVLLVHGWAAHGGFFSDLSAKLSRTHRVVTPTLRGHVGSERGTRPLTVETLGQDILKFVDALDLAPVRALGWSMGAMALWAAAPKLKQRLSGLIVEDIGPRIVNGDGWAFGIAGAYEQENIATTLAEIEGDWAGYVERVTPRLFSNATREQRPELVQWAIAEMAKADPSAMAAFWASMAAQDFRASLPRLPLLAIHGEESMHPAEAISFVADATPLGVMSTIQGVGHVPHLEAPDTFFGIVSEFLLRTNPKDVLREGVNP